MADVIVETVVSLITVTCTISEARALLAFFGTLSPDGAPAVIREISRKFRAAVAEETFKTPVQ